MNIPEQYLANNTNNTQVDQIVQLQQNNKITQAQQIIDLQSEVLELKHLINQMSLRIDEMEIKPKPTPKTEQIPCSQCGKLCSPKGMSKHLKTHETSSNEESKEQIDQSDQKVSCQKCNKLYTKKGLPRHEKNCKA